MLDNCSNIPEHDFKIYEDQRNKTYISFPIYGVYAVGYILFCVDTSAPHSCIGGKPLERIVFHSGYKSIPLIDSKRDFKFGDKLVRSREIVEPIATNTRNHT